MKFELNYKIRLLTVILAFVSMALLPSLLTTQSVNAASHWCEDRTDSGSWNQGCKDGWYDHDHCKKYSPGSGEYASGYKVGWAKGSCK